MTSIGGADSSTSVDTDSGAVTLTTSVSASADDTGSDPDTTVGHDTTVGPETDTDADSDSTTGSTTDVVTDTDADTDTGEEPTAPGQTVSQLVTGGTKAASSNYSAVFTIGQPSKLQSTHDSANYRLQGGLVGANGSPP